MEKDVTKMLFEAITKLNQKLDNLESKGAKSENEEYKSVLRFAKNAANVKADVPTYWEALNNLEKHKAKKAEFRSVKGFWGTGKAN